ncbi:MAG TPA: hypothetical protein VGI06_13975, partial [Acidimicrobiales bacterium]
AEGGEAISAEAWDAGAVEDAQSGDRADPVAEAAAETGDEESDPEVVLEPEQVAPEEAALHVESEPGGTGALADTPQAAVDLSALADAPADAGLEDAGEDGGVGDGDRAGAGGPAGAP